MSLVFDQTRSVVAAQNEERKISLTSTDTEHNSEAKADSAANIGANDSDESD